MSCGRDPDAPKRTRAALDYLNKLTGLDPGNLRLQEKGINPGVNGDVLVTVKATVTEVLSGAGDWICPDGVTSVTVKARAGGGGGLVETALLSAGGGGGGAYSEGAVSVTAGNTYPYDCGEGGRGADATAIAGDGSNATFNATDIVAAGGKGGPSNIIGAAGGLAADCTGTTTRNGGNGGAGSGTALDGGGGGGSSAGTDAVGNVGSDSNGAGLGGDGGVAVTGGGAGGAGGTYGIEDGRGRDGLAPGGGGGGGADGGLGGNGAPGQITLEYQVADVVVSQWDALSALAATSVSNADGSLTISPTTGAVVASLNVAHANTWTGQQTFSKLTISLTVNDTFAWTLTTATP